MPERKSSDHIYKIVNEISKKQEVQGGIIEKLKDSVDKILAALLGDKFNNEKGIIKVQADHECRIKNIEIDKFLVIKISAFVSVCFGILFSALSLFAVFFIR